MKKQKVIAYKNLPLRSPIQLSMIVLLAQKIYPRPGWFWGVIWTLVAINWITWIVSIFREENVDIFEGYSDFFKFKK
jgi:hypothetical protein